MKTKTLNFFSFLIITMLFFSSNSWGEDKVFTNKDLKKYSDDENPSVIFKREAISSDEMKKRSVIPKNEDTPKKPEAKPALPDQDEVIVSISGCRTIQDILDDKSGETNRVLRVLRRGRTIEQICATVGKGCKSCAEVPRQTGDNKSR